METVMSGLAKIYKDRWDSTETFQAACYAFECIKELKQANLSIADINNLQDFLIENGCSISRLTPKPVSEEEGKDFIIKETKINDSTYTAKIINKKQP